MFLTINIFGQGFGPTAMGAISDALARQRFTLGDYGVLCHGAHAPAGAVAAACGQASSGGLQSAVLMMTGFFLWGSLHYLLAARTIRRDLGPRAG